MSSGWQPDDAFLAKRQAIQESIESRVSRDHILTSRDPGMDQLRYELRREPMPAGWLSWQLPVYLLSSPTFFFLQSAAPGAVLPEHSHETDQLRVVLSGGMIYNGLELRSGDWMFIPRGEKNKYTLSASLNPGGCTVMYAY